MDVTFDLADFSPSPPSAAIDVDWTSFDLHHLCDDYYKKSESQPLQYMSQIVKEQLSIHQFAKIDVAKRNETEQNSHHLISSYIASTYNNAPHIIPKEIVHLLRTYYPLFYWNNDYISLQSDSTQIFILAKECCSLSGVLSSYIMNEHTSSTLNIQNIDSNTLELFVTYIVNMHHNLNLHPCNDFVSSDFILRLDDKTLHKLHDAAKIMDCESLAQLTNTQIAALSNTDAADKEYKHSPLVQAVLDSHFQSMQFHGK